MVEKVDKVSLLEVLELKGLRSPQVSGDSAAEQSKVLLDELFNRLRPQVLDTLRKLDHAQHAFQLAEEYLDFKNLASLCHTETVYPPENNPNATRIRSYIDKFKEAFTVELYRWYIEHGLLSPTLNLVGQADGRPRGA